MPVITAQPSSAARSSGQLVGHLHHSVAVHDHLLGEGAQPGDRRDRHVAVAEPGRRTGRPREGPAPLAQPGAPDDALPAAAAELGQAGDHAIAGREFGHVGAHRLDDPGGLVAEHGRHRRRQQALHEVQVAVTQATRRDTDEDLVTGRNVDGELLDGEVARSMVEDGGAHGLTSVVVGPSRSPGPHWECCR